MYDPDTESHVVVIPKVAFIKGRLWFGAWRFAQGNKYVLNSVKDNQSVNSQASIIVGLVIISKAENANVACRKKILTLSTKATRSQNWRDSN